MDPAILTDLAATLRGDEAAGFRQFRRMFFEALQNRQLDACQALLDVLADVASELSSQALQWECTYHEAITFSEKKQFDRAEAGLRRLLNEDPTTYQRARALLTLGIQFNEQGQWPEAENSFRQAQAAYAEIGDDLGQAKAYNNIGIAITFPVEQGTARPERLPEAVHNHRAALGDSERAARERAQCVGGGIRDGAELARIGHRLRADGGARGRHRTRWRHTSGCARNWMIRANRRSASRTWPSWPTRRWANGRPRMRRWTRQSPFSENTTIPSFWPRR